MTEPRFLWQNKEESKVIRLASMAEMSPFLWWPFRKKHWNAWIHFRVQTIPFNWICCNHIIYNILFLKGKCSGRAFFCRGRHLPKPMCEYNKQQIIICSICKTSGEVWNIMLSIRDRYASSFMPHSSWHWILSSRCCSTRWFMRWRSFNTLGWSSSSSWRHRAISNLL